MHGGDVTLAARTAAHAAELHPILVGGRVLDSLLWDGPDSLEAFLASYPAGHGAPSHRHFTILADGRPAGSLSIRPGEDPDRGDLGYWVGEPFQGRGVGTAAVARAVEIAFGEMSMARLEATVFVGNVASRRVLEKNGFHYEGTLRGAVLKRGRRLDEWLFAILSTDPRGAGAAGSGGGR